MKQYKKSGVNRSDPPAITPEAREQQMIYKAERLAERQLEEGTASSAVICHYLKLGSDKAKLEKELLEAQVKLSLAKTESLESAARLETLFEEAASLFRQYQGVEDE